MRSLFLLAFSVSLCAQTKTLTHGAYRMEIVLERGTIAEGSTTTRWKSVDPGYVFAQNDLVRFRFKPNFSGYVYVTNRGTGGTSESLFPRADTGRQNKIENGKEYVVPATRGAFRVAGPEGHDIVYWTVSPVPLGSGSGLTYQPLPPPPPVSDSKELPPDLKPRCDDTIFRSRGDCIDSRAGLKSRGDTGSDKDPVVIKEQSKLIVSSPILEGPVVFEFRLAHR